MPLGLLYLAARLEEAGHEVVLEDIQLCRSPVSRVKRTLQRLNPGVVGITSFSLNLPVASKILRAVKRLCPVPLRYGVDLTPPLTTKRSCGIIHGWTPSSGGREKRLYWRWSSR